MAHEIASSFDSVTNGLSNYSGNELFLALIISSVMREERARKMINVFVSFRDSIATVATDGYVDVWDIGIKMNSGYPV